FDLDQPPQPLTPADQAKIRDHIHAVLAHGTPNARKAMFEALIHEIIIVADDTVRPTFKLPLAGNDEGLAPPRTSPTQRPGQTRGSRTYNCGGRYWDRTSDLFGVNKIMSRPRPAVVPLWLVRLLVLVG